MYSILGFQRENLARGRFPLAAPSLTPSFAALEAALPPFTCETPAF